jgi:hypothetical protein
MLVRICGGRDFIHCWWECKLVHPLWKAVWRFLKKLKRELACELLIPLLGIYAKEFKLVYNRDTCTPIFIAALFTIAKLRNETRCPSTDEWIKKTWSVYTMEYNSILKANEIVLFPGKWTELENFMLSKISQSTSVTNIHKIL